MSFLAWAQDHTKIGSEPCGVFITSPEIQAELGLDLKLPRQIGGGGMLFVGKK
jgi:hypothetical protein